ncbi:hypothetical protein HWD35_02165 [Tsukamurella tyrosinosolvens]|uniref:hypothetical protein n=1 Tax=Tsukamurella tyrosinosolvens TaxID=57704 RepID=UPI0012E7D7D4|nr:hypothetical protein [Tsukamurella tyrosinosolvens]MCA4993506.1 hypothetical protein [Tsukamurella tyrosinosolvens]
MIDPNRLLDLAAIPLVQRDSASLESRLSIVEEKLEPLLAQANPSIVNLILEIQPTLLTSTLQSTGALERLIWVTVHRARGASMDIQLLQKIVNLLTEAWVIMLALSLHGGHRGLAPMSKEAMSGTRDLISRMSSRTMSFCWINQAICHSIAATIADNPAWQASCPNVNKSEIDGLLRWAERNLRQPEPKPLTQGEPGYLLGSDLSQMSPGDQANLRAMLQERGLESTPLRETSAGLLLATPRSFPTKLYIALLELAQIRWQPVLQKRKIPQRDKGSLFEQAIHKLLTAYYGIGQEGNPPFKLKLNNGKKTDVDGLHTSPGYWVMLECKSYAPGAIADDAHSKLLEEVSKINQQLGDSAVAVRSGTPIISSTGPHLLSSSTSLIRIGIVVDPAHTLSSHKDDSGEVHLFTAEGFVAAVATTTNVNDLGQYLTARSSLLKRRAIQDECDLLISHILGTTTPLPHELPSPDMMYFTPKGQQQWRTFLATNPQVVHGGFY